MLTPAQSAIVKAYILADPVLAPLTTGVGTDYSAIADALSAEASPAFVVWRTSVGRAEVQDDAAFDWTVVDNLATGSKFRIWEWMFGTTGTINPSQSNIRAGIAACWTGNAALNAVQAMVLGKCKRNAKVVEKLLATGTGTTVSPALMTYEGGIGVFEIGGILAA